MKTTSTLYQISLRPFTPEGTLKGAEKMLPHIASLGFDIVYLCPIFDADDDTDPKFWSPNHMRSQLTLPQNPYRMRDYYKIDEEYGTDADLHSFVKAAHEQGLKVLLDLVYFHCGPRAAFIDEHPDYVVCDADGNVTCGRWNFPQLNYESEGLREYLYGNMEYFIKEFDVDGYRCDVAEYVPLDFWAEGRRRILDINPDAILVNEGDGVPYNEEVFQAYYNFKFGHNLRKALRGEISAADFVAAASAHRALMPPQSIPLNFLDNHDTVKDVLKKFDRIENIIGSDRMEAAMVLLYTAEGIPFIYNGNEICDTRKHTLYANRFNAPELSINWSNACTPAAERRMRIMRELANLHRNNDILVNGSMEWLTVGDKDNVVAFQRRYEGRSVIVVINISGETVNTYVDVAIALESKVLMQNNLVVTSRKGRTAFVAEGGGYIVIEQ